MPRPAIRRQHPIDQKPRSVGRRRGAADDLRDPEGAGRIAGGGCQTFPTPFKRPT
jgi:hypothetical protein